MYCLTTPLGRERTSECVADVTVTLDMWTMLLWCASSALLPAPSAIRQVLVPFLSSMADDTYHFMDSTRRLELSSSCHRSSILQLSVSTHPPFTMSRQEGNASLRALSSHGLGHVAPSGPPRYSCPPPSYPPAPRQGVQRHGQDVV